MKMGFRRWLVALLMLLGGVPVAYAATYAYTNDVFSWQAPSGAATTVTWTGACTGYPGGDDDYALVNFTGGFTFTFAGTAYSQVRILSNGMLQFGAADQGFHRDYTPQAMPAPASTVTQGGCPNLAPTNVMMLYWIDINTSPNVSNAPVQYEMLGTAPNRRFVVTWNNVALYGNTNTRYTFQAILYESTAGLNGNFKYQYTAGASTGTGATVGVQVSNSDYTQYSYNQAFIDPASGTAILWYPANQLAAKTAEYRFDEGVWNGTANEVKDTSGSSNHGVRVGAATNITAGKLCRGGLFTSNTSNSTIDAVSTPISPSSVGSLDFWYNSATKWNTSDAMLIDATTVAARPFFLMKKSNGSLQFTLTDSGNTVRTLSTSNYTTAAGTWVHVGMSWNLRPGTNQTLMQIFVNGVAVASSRLTSSGSITALSTIYIGDNRTSGVTPSTGSPNGANGTIDEVYIYPTEINATQAAADMNIVRGACGTLDHFHIIHSGELVNCGNPVTNVTIESHDATHALLSLAGTTLALSTSTNHGTWTNVSGGAINTVNDQGNGNATYTFSNEASITLGLQDTYVESLNINTTSGSVTEKSGAAASCVSNDYTFGSVCDANLNFDQAGFRFVDATGNNIGNQVSGVTSGSYFLQAVKSTCTTPGTCTGACVAVFPSGSAVSIDLASECVNPITCQSGQAVTITPGAGAGAAGTIANNNAGAVSDSSGSFTTKSLTFNATSPSPAVPFTLNYPDAGQMRLWARYLGSSTISGSSAAFVVAPHHFDLSVGTAAPITAGSNFSTTVTARNSAGAATPNFGKETTAPTVAVASSNPVPALGNATAINTTFSGFSAGAATQNLIWKEVGTIDLGASTTNYLGSGMGVSGSLAGVGRFKPAYFKTQVTQGCAAGAYTYSAQPFTVTTTAYETGGAVTANYAGATWAKAVALTAITAAAGTLGNGAVAATEFAAGVSAHATTTYTFTSPKTAATAPVIRATDTDGVTSAGVPSGEGAVAVRSGRISLRSNYGSELLDLSVPMRAEYWNGSGWSNNDLDVCTSGVTMSLTDVVATDGLVPGETCVQDTANPGLSGLGCAAAGPVSKRFAQPPLAGGFNLWLQAPGPGNTGALNLTANVPAWLKYDWNGTGTAINPTVRETFGLRKTPIIYMRENF